MELFYEYIVYCLIVALFFYSIIFIYKFFKNNGKDILYLLVKEENRFYVLNLLGFTLVYFLLGIILILLVK